MKSDDALGCRHKSLITHFKFNGTGNGDYGTAGLKHLTVESYSEDKVLLL